MCFLLSTLQQWCDIQQLLLTPYDLSVSQMRKLRLRGVSISSPRLVDGRAEILTHARGSSHDLPSCVLGDFIHGAESKQPSTGSGHRLLV